MHVDPPSPFFRDVSPGIRGDSSATGVQLRSPEEAQRPRASSASMSEFGSTLIELALLNYLRLRSDRAGEKSSKAKRLAFDHPLMCSPFGFARGCHFAASFDFCEDGGPDRAALRVYAGKPECS